MRRALFPIGHLEKTAVRQLASDSGLPTQDRKDSQGICFLGKIDYRDFVKFHLGEVEGDIVEIETGEKLGRHQGVWFYTIGQRHGLRLGGGPWYVVRKDIGDNTVYVSHKDHMEERQRRDFSVAQLNWIAGAPPNRDDLQVKLRHGPQSGACHIHHLDDERLAVDLSTPDPGIAAGQHAVFYDGDICLGGGIIQ